MNRIMRTALAGLLTLSAAACNQSSYSTSTDTTAGLSVEPSSRDIVVGETVTLVAHTRDTYGRDAKVKWTTTSGSIKEEQSGRVARVKFSDVGTYSVKAALSIDDKVVQTEMVEIRVKPIR